MNKPTLTLTLIAFHKGKMVKAEMTFLVEALEDAIVPVGTRLEGAFYSLKKSINYSKTGINNSNDKPSH